MNTKLITVFLAILSALGVAYFAFDVLRSFGSVAQLTADTYICVVALVVLLSSLGFAWGGIWWVSQAQSAKGYILKLLGSSALAWGILFFGSIYLALLRFQ